jgi:branched-chain amino acid transport system substrate-binding protein
VPSLPSGTVTFLFTDIEGSTRLLKQLGDEYANVLVEHQRLLRETFAAHQGHEVDTQGDSFFVVFPTAKEAVAAAVDAQRALAAHDWPDGAEVRVRMGLHSGEPIVGGERYVGLGVHQAARVGAAGHGGQVLLSSATRELVKSALPDGVTLRDLGDRRLKDIDHPERIYQLVVPGLRNDFPKLKTAERSPARKRRVALTMVAALLVVGGIAGGLLGTSGGGGTAESLSSVTPDSVAVVAAKSKALTGQVSIPGGPSLVVAAGPSVWVASDASRTISSIATTTETVTHIVPLNATPGAMTADGDTVWVLDGVGRRLLKVDPAYSAVTRRIKLPPAPQLPATNSRLSSLAVAWGEGALWVTDGSSRLLRVDPHTGHTDALDVHEALDDVAVGNGSVWAVSGEAATLYRVDPHKLTLKTRIPVVNKLGATSPFPVAVAVGEGSVWVLNGNTQTVTKVDPDLEGISATIPLGIGSNPNDITTGEGAIWVANGGNGTLTSIDASSDEPTTIPVGSSPAGVAVGGGKVWASVQPGFRVSVAPPGGLGGQASEVAALPASICSPVEFPGKGRPRFLIASDLPLQGQESLAETLQQSDAIRFVLAQHRFTAGPYKVGYQSCDDSLSQTGGYDDAKCTANAKAYAGTSDVIAVIGGYNSGCALKQIPVLGAAPGGPLALVSGDSTYVGLTHAGPGTAPGEPDVFYPHGRNFVRVVAADDVQGAADALLARDLGVERLYVLNDKDTYGFGIASDVRHAAAKLGLDVVGFEAWNPKAHDYRALARRIRASHANGVFLGGTVDTSNGPQLVKDLRSVLDRRVRILTPDGFTPIKAFAQLAGPAAEGVTVSFPAAPPERLGPAGHRFVAEFQGEIGRPVEAYTVAVAQATEILLDAIARSDGTRKLVTTNLLDTRVRNGILGSFSIDRNGDTTAGAVTIFKIVNGKPVVYRVIKPPPSLVR